MMSTRCLFFAFFIATSLLNPSHTAAGTRWVSSLADAGPGSLRQVMKEAQSGDTLYFSVRGTITLDSQLVSQNQLSIFGPGPDSLSLDGQQLSRILFVALGDTLHISGIHFQHGRVTGPIERGGGAIRNRGILHLSRCRFSDNQAVNGGAIETSSFGGDSTQLILNHCAFYRNTATIVAAGEPSAGGALYANGRQGGQSLISARNCTFSENKAIGSGGAVFLIGDPQGGVRLESSFCTFAFNEAEKNCGGIDNSQAEPLQVNNTLVAENIGNPTRPDIWGTIFSRGYNLIGDTSATKVDPFVRPTDQVGVAALIAPLAFNGSPFPTHALRCGSPAIDGGELNTAPLQDLRGRGRVGAPDIGSHERDEAFDLQIVNRRDAGYGSLRQAILLACQDDTLSLHQISGTITLTRTLDLEQSLTLIGNRLQAVSISGADSLRLLEVASGITVSLSWLTLRQGNPALFGGGAILNKGQLTLTYCTLRDNRAQSGGAIANYGDGDTASVMLRNCTLSGNEAVWLDGGALDNRSFSHPAFAELIHCTLAQNKAANKGGGIYQQGSGSVSLRSSLLAQNQAPQGPDAFGELLSAGYNLIGTGADFMLINSQQDILNSQAQIDPLGYYGGPSFTHRLQAGSPAIDAGGSAVLDSLDQRGEARVFNTQADIGAYEYDPATRLVDLPATPWDIHLFPNPVESQLFLRWHTESVARAQWRIIDLMGRVWQRGTLSRSVQGLWKFSVNALPAGVYLFQLQVGTQQKSRKFIRR